MQRMLLTVALLALLGASGLFVGVQTASADEHAMTAMAGQAIEPVVGPVVPEGMGTPPFTYSVSPDLPAGLTIDPATGTISGTPTAASEATEYTITITDAAGASAPWPQPVVIEVEAAPSVELSDAYTYGVGEAIAPVVLPTVPAGRGTGTLTYTLTPDPPAGLTYDEATRTISGTPTAVAATTVYTFAVTDEAGGEDSISFSIEVVLPDLDAPDALEAQDYMGADGAGDQGGFVLLTWDLSEDHDSLDGYRIWREIPALDGEMIPWAMVDAVPGVEIGRAIVATLDNTFTRWGISAEADGRSSAVTAKAVFVQAGDQPYALMAETLMASREAAQAGDAPVFASLLPEALAYAQGVAPRLNVVEGVLAHSAITITEEPVGAIDNIAPLAVPSLSALDVPNDEGSRIALMWELSLSDRLLQGIVAEAIGPAALEPVVGVHGYSIYRKTGAEEFVLVAQVEAGVTSFIDETALNGMRYTYQVRPFDLDNETGSDIEQTAMAVRNVAVDSEGRAIVGLFGADNRVGFDDFFILADLFGLTAEDAGFDPAFDLAPSAMIDFDDFFVFADNFGRSVAGAGKRVPMLAGLNADARMYLDARTGMPSVDEEFVLDVRVADFVAVKGYGLQVQYDASQLEFVRALTDQPLGGSEFAAPQVLSDEGGILALAAHGDVVADGEVALSLVFRAKTEIEDTVIEIIDNQTYDSEFGFNRLALPAPVQLQTRPEAFGLANNYPNPFNPATTIKYALPQAADVELTVYNVIGQPVRTLVAEHQNAGRYVVEWDATNDSGHSLSSGMYFYRLQAGGEFLETKKMLLLK
ncbi:MAG: T9SS type A sorting domain-containing protein [Gemmatimonadetes bacterium]|nr:T9SS type A sorting domain-containing protein [Gemmatimonadota bacterium]